MQVDQQASTISQLTTLGGTLQDELERGVQQALLQAATLAESNALVRVSASSLSRLTFNESASLKPVSHS